jgi:hypothetical protein
LWRSVKAVITDCHFWKVLSSISGPFANLNGKLSHRQIQQLRFPIPAEWSVHYASTGRITKVYLCPFRANEVIFLSDSPDPS